MRIADVTKLLILLNWGREQATYIESWTLSFDAASLDQASLRGARTVLNLATKQKLIRGPGVA